MERNVIDGFENLTPEQCVRMSVAHVLKTGKKSSNGSSCTYGGVGCAAAPFLTPKAREKYADHGGWEGLIDMNLVPNVNSKLIRQLQICHDASESTKDFVDQFKFLVKSRLPSYAYIVDEEEKRLRADS